MISGFARRPMPQLRARAKGFERSSGKTWLNSADRTKRENYSCAIIVHLDPDQLATSSPHGALKRRLG